MGVGFQSLAGENQHSSVFTTVWKVTSRLANAFKALKKYLYHTPVHAGCNLWQIHHYWPGEGSGITPIVATGEKWELRCAADLAGDKNHLYHRCHSTASGHPDNINWAIQVYYKSILSIYLPVYISCMSRQVSSAKQNRQKP